MPRHVPGADGTTRGNGKGSNKTCSEISMQ